MGSMDAQTALTVRKRNYQMQIKKEIETGMEKERPEETWEIRRRAKKNERKQRFPKA